MTDHTVVRMRRLAPIVALTLVLTLVACASAPQRPAEPSAPGWSDQYLYQSRAARAGIY
jgi:starvation-inducible outer membrane lipoprotein